MVPNIYLVKNDGGPFGNLERYKKLVRKLNYLTGMAQLDIALL